MDSPRDWRMEKRSATGLVMGSAMGLATESRLVKDWAREMRWEREICWAMEWEKDWVTATGSPPA